MRIARIGRPSGYSGIGGVGAGFRTNPISHQPSGPGLEKVAGKVVEEETPGVEYSSNSNILPPLGERMKGLVAENVPKPMSVPRRKAPLWKAVEAVETDAPDPVLTAVTIGGVATPKTSYRYASMTMGVPGMVIVIVSAPLEVRVV
jgi:hypothetical protein